MTMRDTVFKTLNKIGVSKVLRWAKGQSITVISLHRVSEQRDFFFDPIDPKTFEKMIESYSKHYHITSFKDISQKTTKPKLILSFDDGYYDFIEYALPILKKYGLPCNHNLVNACLSNNSVIWTQKLNDIFNHLKKNNIVKNEIIDKTGSTFNNDWIAYYISFFKELLKLDSANRNAILEDLACAYNIRSNYRMLNWEDAKNCVENYDVEIGCHTFNHESLLSITKQNELELEIGNSIDELEEKLGIKVNILALPNGQFNDTVIAYARSIGIKYTLLHNDKVTPAKRLNDHFNLINRIILVNESVDEAMLRTELFHTNFRKIL